MGSLQEWGLMAMYFLLVACPTAFVVLTVLLVKKRVESHSQKVSGGEVMEE